MTENNEMGLAQQVAVSPAENEVITDALIEQEINDDFEEIESLKRELSGLPNDQIELVKSINSKEDRQKAIELAKRQRADKDRLYLELGNTKKELERMNGFLQTIENQRQSGVSQGVDERLPEDDYLTEQERILKTKIIQLENQVKRGDQDRTAAENYEIISEFSADKPDFVNLEQDIALAVDILNKKKGVAITIKSRKERLDEAYKLAKSLNNADKTEVELERFRQQEQLRKQKIEESKRLKRFSKTDSSAPLNLTPSQKISLIWSNNSES